MEKKTADSNVMNRTIDRLAPNRVAPLPVFILLLVIYAAATLITSITSSRRGNVELIGFAIPISACAGVFSSLANICVIFMTVFCGKKGYFTALAILILQFPIIGINVFVRKLLSSLPGMFASLLAIVAITLIYFYNKKMDSVQKEMRRQAVTDVLTGLPNVFATTQLITNLISHKEKFVNVTVNINNFKNLNDTMGYDVGNRVLIEAAERWKKVAASAEEGTIDFISHLSGDEFALVIRKYNSLGSAVNTIRRYEKALSESFTIDDCDMYITASFGYTEYPTDADTLDKVCSYATVAMREVKRTNSSNHILRFTPDLIKMERTIEIEGKIRTALDKDLIFFNLQPQFDVTHRLRGFEALARMKDIDGNVISPGDFIPVSEKVGLVDKVDGVVFRKSAIFFGELIRKYDLDISLSVNISVRHLMKNDFVDEVRNNLKLSGIAPYQLEIEITESIMIESVDKALQCIGELVDMGVKIAIDDFGTGYSSLSYLHKFPADLLKIDKSFIDKMNMSTSSREYVAAIISIGHILGFEVISEGVEEDEQLETLKDINCDYIQGFIWGRPLMPDAAEELVRNSVK